MSSLAVWMYGRQIGLLSRQRGRLSFSYSEEAQSMGLGRPLLSVAMPTQAARYGGNAAHAFFEGLLPEGDARGMIAHDFGVSENDVLAMLGAIGRDCAGALVIVPEGEVPGEEGRPEPISDAQVAERLRNLRIAPLGVDQRVRVSLAGQQNKLLLARLEDGWGLPVDGAPSTHILKPPHAFLNDVIANEAFSMRFAHHLGLPVPNVETGSFNGIEVLIVQRYDRSPADGQGRVHRLHQEDFLQAHSMDSSRKYEENGGPSLRQCAELLERWSAGRDSLLQLLDITVANVLLGNCDAHAKNLSLLHGFDGEITLAPAYDLMTTLYYPNVSRVPGMYVNGVQEMTQIHPADLVEEAAGWGVDRGIAEERVSCLVAAAEEAVSRAASDVHPPADLENLVLDRVRSLAL